VKFVPLRDWKVGDHSSLVHFAGYGIGAYSRGDGVSVLGLLLRETVACSSTKFLEIEGRRFVSTLATRSRHVKKNRRMGVQETFFSFLFLL
jgi:uncharacterized protein YdiU (UPF0061 family)